MKSICAISAVASVIALSGSALADINPWDFNVFSRSTIGTSGSPYGSDFEGAAGAVGNAYFNGFSLRAIAGSSASLPQSFYGGGSLTLGGSIKNGGAEVFGDVNILSADIQGTVHSHGNLGGTSGSISGPAFFSGIFAGVDANQITVNGIGSNGTYGAAFSATVNLASVSSYFLSVSTYAAGLASTVDNMSGTATHFQNINGGAITVDTNGNSINVVTISAADLNNAYGFTVNGTGTVIVNVLGTGTVSLDSTTWAFSGGATSRNVLLNYTQASVLNLSGGNFANLLAPNTTVNYSSGQWNGVLVAGALTGSGQVNWVGPGNFSLVPAPSAAGALALGGLASFRRKRRI